LERRRPFPRNFLLSLALLLIIAVVTRSLWLPWFGRFLVHVDPPEKADIAVVLGGDVYGLRILRAAQLVRDGYVPKVLVSGPPLLDIHECDFTIAYAVRQGNPAGWFECFPNRTSSTREEARVIVNELQRRQVRRFLLITSDYHTARARRLYLATIPGTGLDFRTVASSDQYFRAESWWKDRESEKVVFFEWSKTIATALGK
jgi:uncharacterized SAM-binding protein YcdF (DUF218 family)